MDFATPYDLSKHITEAFGENLRSTKWSERKDAIQDLVNVMEKNPVLSPNDQEYQMLIDDLSKVLSKDSNINVAATAASALSKLASGTPGTFKHNASSVILICLTKMKDVKPVIKNACSECLDSVYSTTTFANVLEPIKQGLSITAPGSKIQTCEFFTRIMLKIDFPTAKSSAAGTKEIIDLLCKLALGSDLACREASMRSLAAFMRAVSKNIALPLLAPVAADKLKMEKVEENYEQFIVEFPFDDGTKKSEAAAPPPSSNSNGTKQAANVVSEPAAVDSRLFATPYNLAKHITEEFYTNLHSPKWSERRDAIQDLVNVMEKNPVFVPNDQEYQKLIDDLSKVLNKDSNINVAASAAQALAKIAFGIPKTFKHNASNVILICFTRMKDVKPVIKNACSECLDSTYATTTFAGVLEPIKQGLAITAPGSKIQTCEFFTRIMLKIDFPTAKSSASGTKEIIDVLCKLALSSDVACREAAMRALASFMRAVSKNIALPLLAPVAGDKLKMEKIEENYEQFISEFPFDDGTQKQAVRQNPKPVSKNNAAPEKVVEQPVEEQVVEKVEVAVVPQIVETPLVRAMNQATSETFQQMHRIVSDDLASMPLESLLDLNHVMPRRLGALPTGEIDQEQIDEDDLLNVDPKTAISEALNNLNSAQMSLANSAIVALMALVQDSFNQKTLASKANSIFVAVIGKFKEVSELYTSQQANSIEAKDCEEYLRQASNFLLKFIPQPAVAQNIDAGLFESLTLSLLSLLASFEETNVSIGFGSFGKSQRRNIQALFNCMCDNFPINTVLLSSIKLTGDFVKLCVPEEISNPGDDYRRTKNGCKLHQLLLVISRALESCETKKERHSEVDVYNVQLAFSKATYLIHNPPANAPQKGAVKSSICYVLQKFVKANMIQALIAAVRLDENTKYSEYIHKTHQAFLVRELSTQGDDKVEAMLCGYTSRLIKKFSEHDFTFALESLYGIYKHCVISNRFKPMHNVFTKTVKSSVFAPIIEEALHKMNETYMAGEDLDIEDYLFSNFMGGAALELYRTTQKLCKMILTKPNVQELDEFHFESDFLNQLRQLGGGTSDSNQRLDEFAEPLAAHDPNRTLTIYRTPERTKMSEDETLNLFKTVSKPRRTSGIPSVKIPSHINDKLQKHLNGD